MTRDEYADYLQGEWWTTFRERYWKNHQKQCAVCGTAKCLELHHITYKRLGKEQDGDIRPLCGEHHEQVHKELKRRGWNVWLTDRVIRELKGTTDKVRLKPKKVKVEKRLPETRDEKRKENKRKRRRKKKNKQQRRAEAKANKQKAYAWKIPATKPTITRDEAARRRAEEAVRRAVMGKPVQKVAPPGFARVQENRKMWQDSQAWRKQQRIAMQLSSPVKCKSPADQGNPVN